MQVNREMLRFYWSLGRDIVARDAENVYGSGFYRNLSQGFEGRHTGSRGFFPAEPAIHEEDVSSL